MERAVELNAYLTDLAGALTMSVDAFVPVPMAASALGIEQTTVRSYVRNGTLKSISIKSDYDEQWNGVTLASLVAEMARRNLEVDELVRKVGPMLDRVSETVEYGILMDAVGLSWRNPQHRGLMGKVLGRLSEASSASTGLMISVCVVGKGNHRPNGAFYDLARHLKLLRADDNEEEFWQAQMKKFRSRHRG